MAVMTRRDSLGCTVGSSRKYRSTWSRDTFGSLDATTANNVTADPTTMMQSWIHKVLGFFRRRAMILTLGVASALTSPRAYVGREASKYVGAGALQYAAIVGSLSVVDRFHVPVEASIPIFAALSLRSRVFSLLDNSRPDRKAQGGATPADVKRPDWTPPGVAFPVIWLTITALRAVSASQIYEATASLVSWPLRTLVFHLVVGDVWNTITNVEKRLGVSMVGVLFVWLSLADTCLAFYKVSPLAAYILCPSLVWVSIATALTFNIWILNGRRPLAPSPDDGTSARLRFANLLQARN